jgi:uncharacterized repeat protein (TIGR02543 family)
MKQIHGKQMYLLLIAVLAVIGISSCSLSGVSGNVPLNTKYTVAYAGNGNDLGTAPTDSRTYLQGSSVTVLGNSGAMTKTNYTFAGWNTLANGTGTGYAVGAIFRMGSVNSVLYAVWMPQPIVTSTYPDRSSTGVAINSSITATFSEAMDATTITTTTFTLSGGVNGKVVYDVASKNATFAPTSNLANGTIYTATITTGVKNVNGAAMSANYVWSFTTASAGLGPSPVNLGTAGNYVILAKTEITDVPPSAITGNMGLSPAAESFITGFTLTDATGYATSAQVTGFIYAANMAPPTPSNMTTAIADMQTAYTDAAGRAGGTGPNLNLGAGTINGNTLTPGTYTWGTGLDIAGSITLSGGANDTWIFQIAGNLTVGNGVIVTLSGGAQAKNIVWQLSGEATLGTTSQFKGIILSQTAINLQTGAKMTGRALAQSGVTLESNTITTP